VVIQEHEDGIKWAWYGVSVVVFCIRVGVFPSVASLHV
jgi:hypothetical protein